VSELTTGATETESPSAQGSRVRLAPRAPRSRRPTVRSSTTSVRPSVVKQRRASGAHGDWHRCESPRLRRLQAGRSTRSSLGPMARYAYAMRRSSELPATMVLLPSFLPTCLP